MINNIQPIEKRDHHKSSELSVISIFKTIQGEGPFTGHRAIFVRLAGCNLQCPGCDTDYTTDRKTVSNSQILEEIHRLDPDIKLVVITGGEPFRQYISPLANTLIQLEYDVQIETNGTLPPSEDLSDFVCIVCSPKTGKLNPVLSKRVDAFKYVLCHNSVDITDGLPIYALDHTASPKVARPPKDFKGPVYLQPMDVQNNIGNAMNIRVVKESCLNFNYILQLQIHKIIGIE